MTDNNNLTILERGIDWYQEGIGELPVVRTAADVFMAAKLSKLTMKIMERHHARLVRKQLPRKPTKARGRYHHKRKAATARSRAAKRWAVNPYGCLINGKGSWNLDRKQFDRHIAPLWVRYAPADLLVKKRRGAGKASDPYTIYDLQVWHGNGKAKEKLWDGNSLRLYHLSGGLD